MAARKSKKKTQKNPARKPVRKAATRGSGKQATRRTVPKKAARRARSRPSVGTLAAEKARLEANKQLVLAFYQQMIGEKDPEAARPYMATRYVQHSAYARDDFEGVAEFARQFKRDFPRHRYEVKKCIAEGDFVVLHLHGINGMSPHGEQVVDIFRVKDGKVCEHWDVIQPIPGDSSNPNGTF
jgi:predicted SnoaL-like aldol condensation-catalyzing enzyme